MWLVRTGIDGQYFSGDAVYVLWTGFVDVTGGTGCNALSTSLLQNRQTSSACRKWIATFAAAGSITSQNYSPSA